MAISRDDCTYRIIGTIAPGNTLVIEKRDRELQVLAQYTLTISPTKRLRCTCEGFIRRRTCKHCGWIVGYRTGYDLYTV